MIDLCHLLLLAAIYYNGLDISKQSNIMADETKGRAFLQQATFWFEANKAKIRWISISVKDNWRDSCFTFFGYIPRSRGDLDMHVCMTLGFILRGIV